MSLEIPVVIGSFVIGIAVGLTGMGGGAVMTPVLVLLFRVQPLAAVSSDLVASLVIRPFGSALHMRRHTVRWDLVGWLSLGSVPAAFLGSLLLRALGTSAAVDAMIQYGLGGTLLLAVGAMAARRWLLPRRSAPVPGRGLGQPTARPAPRASARTRRLATVAVGAAGGLAVGVTSAGSGTLIVVALMLLNPRLGAREVVGTDLVQAIPLLAAAALGHAVFGSVQLGLTASLVTGGVPGTVAGAWISSRAGGTIIRPALAAVLLVSALRLLGVPSAILAVALAAAAIAGGVGLAVKRVAGRRGPRRAGSVAAAPALAAREAPA